MTGETLWGNRNITLITSVKSCPVYHCVPSVACVLSVICTSSLSLPLNLPQLHPGNGTEQQKTNITSANGGTDPETKTGDNQYIGVKQH